MVLNKNMLSLINNLQYSNVYQQLKNTFSLKVDVMNIKKINRQVYLFKGVPLDLIVNIYWCVLGMRIFRSRELKWAVDVFLKNNSR